MTKQQQPQQSGIEASTAEKLANLLVDINFFARQPYVFDLSHQAIRALQFVHRADAPPRIDQIAGLLGTAASTASELAKRMERKGLVTRRRSKADERVVEVRMTEAGLAALANHTSVDLGKLESALAALPPDERAGLVASMEALLQALRPDETGKSS